MEDLQLVYGGYPPIEEPNGLENSENRIGVARCVSISAILLVLRTHSNWLGTPSEGRLLNFPGRL